MSEIIVVRVKPGSRKGPLVEPDDAGVLTVYVREPAVDGKANRAVLELLAKRFEVPRSHVELVSGATARLKRFRITPRISR
ncbi:DUF167 domain-containing protein [Mycobacterium sp. 1274756.6]|uniref:DUF167 domain-containing protein n=1 Tax=Mycobacterium sp. 1274756.6 TaxID=1834076 RepID=UPI00080081E9|nr:DUF167 domain-containing protein [Mycobacterium sp. 1274756.6]OBJ71702.1 hypothetical protein A5643_07250 [Mycobacterium sp. 1274756.6]